jgi:hypothetical protein
MKAKPILISLKSLMLGKHKVQLLLEIDLATVFEKPL